MEADFDQVDGAYLKKVTGLEGNSTFFYFYSMPSAKWDFKKTKSLLFENN